MHLGLNETAPSCPNRPSWEPSRLTKAPDGPQGLTLNVLWLQKEGAWIRLPDRGQGLTPTENVDRGLTLRTALPAQWAVCQPHQMEVPTQGVVPGKKSRNQPGLSPSKGQKPNPGTPTGPGDQLPSLSLVLTALVRKEELRSNVI
jgi:hypothetical protein